MSTPTKIEFAVQMSGEKCADKVRSSLSDIENVDIDVNLGRVIVTTKLPWSEIQDRIEKTGRRAVLSGFGGQSAVAIINDSQNQIKGVIRFSQIGGESEGCIVDGTVDGLKPGLHGIHIFECGDLSNGCESLGGHYNPRNSPHGSPDEPENSRHVGDLGNIRAEKNGRAVFRFIDPLVEVWDIIGRSVAVSEHEDDFGTKTNGVPSDEGNCGRRLACGIIARSAGIYQNYKRICACDGVTIWDERNKPIAGGNRNENARL